MHDQSIAETADKVWDALNRYQSPVTMVRLMRHVGERGAVIHRALGWLAHEDKVLIETRGMAETYRLKPV